MSKKKRKGKNKSKQRKIEKRLTARGFKAKPSSA